MDPTLRNQVIDVLNAAGLYRAALGAKPLLAEAKGVPSPLLALIQINLAESDYNLGRWAEAWRRLEGLDVAARRLPITRAGLLQQRAWIAAHNGEAVAALELCDQVDIDWLPRWYHAEYYFTRAVAWLESGRPDRAADALDAARRVAVRRSSKRNALFLSARVAAARRDWATAAALCETAAADLRCGQGGDGLLLWGDALVRLGRVDEARAAWRLAIERDPESESAQLAGQQLT